jgi:hypothetical protein
MSKTATLAGNILVTGLGVDWTFNMNVVSTPSPALSLNVVLINGPTALAPPSPNATYLVLQPNNCPALALQGPNTDTGLSLSTTLPSFFPVTGATNTGAGACNVTCAGAGNLRTAWV